MSLWSDGQKMLLVLKPGIEGRIRDKAVADALG
jgi:hypothetical protein